MDRRSWLWRRKSSEKSPGETESSGSISSRSERGCSDEQAFAVHGSQSLEVASKADVVADEDASDRVSTLSERLSAALLNIREKDELVKQHAKVAEEAVSGWEKAETEVSVLKKQLESANERNSWLENRLGHLDGALKECVRQLRQSREEQEQRTRESEFANSDLRRRLDAAERDNSVLKSELRSRVEELEVRTIELELSTKAAEAASKQNLESIKKAGKLDAEIHRLKASARKMDSASSFCIDLSSVDSQSDIGDRLRAVDFRRRDEFDNSRNRKKNSMVSSLQIDLMDDFLEIERLAGLPETEAGSSRNGDGSVSAEFAESRFRSELNAMINRTAELEEEIERKDAEKAASEAAMRQFREKLDKSETCLKEAEVRLAELEARLLMAEELKRASEEKMEDVAAEMEGLRARIKGLEGELWSEQAEKAEKDEKCRSLEEEISRMREEAELRQETELQQAAKSGYEIKLKQEQELAAAADKFAECQRTIASLGQKLKSLAALEDFLVDSDKIPGPVNEEDSVDPEDSETQHKSDSSDLSSDKRESQKHTRDNFSGHIERAREKGGTNPSRNWNFTSDKSRHGLGKLSSRGNKPGS